MGLFPMADRRIRTLGRGTVGAPAPIDDLGLVDREAGVVGRGETGRLTDRAVDVDDGATRPAHEVMVVVAHPSLVAGD